MLLARLNKLNWITYFWEFWFSCSLLCFVVPLSNPYQITGHNNDTVNRRLNHREQWGTGNFDSPWSNDFKGFLKWPAGAVSSLYRLCERFMYYWVALKVGWSTNWPKRPQLLGAIRAVFPFVLHSHSQDFLHLVDFLLDAKCKSINQYFACDKYRSDVTLIGKNIYIHINVRCRHAIGNWYNSLDYGFVDGSWFEMF